MLSLSTGQWANIAIRWSTLQYNDTTSYIKRKSNEEFVGGLEVKIFLHISFYFFIHRFNGNLFIFVFPGNVKTKPFYSKN